MSAKVSRIGRNKPELVSRLRVAPPRSSSPRSRWHSDASGLELEEAASLLGELAVDQRRRRAGVCVDVEIGAEDAELEEQPLQKRDREPAELLGVEILV